MKKTLNLRKILLIVFGFLFAISAAAFGLSLRLENSYAETDYSLAENWFNVFNADVTQTKISDDRFEFSRESDGGVISFRQAAFDYLISQGYDAIRITYVEKTPATGTNLGIYRDGEIWRDSVWTYGVEQSRTFDITGGAFSVHCAKASVTEFYFTFKAINTAALYEDVEEWFDVKVPYSKVGDNSFDFTVAGDVNTTILKFSAEALDYLTGKGYDKIRITYYGKNGAAINMGLRISQGEWLGWTSNKAPVSAEVEISSLKSAPEVIAYYVPQDGTDGFNVTFKAINTAALYEDVEEWFTAEVPYTKVSDNSFDFTVAGGAEKTILKFNAEALDYLAGKGYDEIRLTYYGKNGAAINMGLKNSDWLGWTGNKAPISKEIKIVDLKAKPNIVAFYVAAEGIDGFNITFKAINTANKEVTFNVNGEFNKTVEVEWNEVSLAAAMPQVTEADTTVIGYALNGKLYATASAVFTAASGIEGDLTIDVIAIHLETQDGAEIRASGTAGLRFTSLVGKSAHFSEFGMILTVRSNVDTNSENAKAVGIENFDKESLTAASLKYIDIVSTASGFNSYEKNGNTVFNLVLTNISEAHLTMQYIARTYVTVKYADGTTVTYYSDVDFENNARAPQDVGYSALDNAELSGITEDQKAFIKENYLSKKA